MSRFLSCMIVTLSLYAASSWAGTVQLFSKDGNASKPSADYQQLVDHLKYGDTVVFSSGRKFKVGKLLGTGNTTLIFALVGDQQHVLRIPKHVGRFLRPGNARPENFDTEEFIDWFVEGVREIEGTHLPVVHIKESLSHEYIEVDRLESDMVSFGDFANRFDSFSERERGEMVKAMDRFLVKSSDKESIMDLHEGNLVYLPHRKQWIISDVSSGVEDFDPGKRITVRSKTVLNGLTEDLEIRKGSSLDSQVMEWKKLIVRARKGQCDLELSLEN